MIYTIDCSGWEAELAPVMQRQFRFLIHIFAIWKSGCVYGGSPDSWLGGPFFDTPPLAEGFTFPSTSNLTQARLIGASNPALSH